MTSIVAYDIEDDRIRQRLANYLLKHGVRLQKSVFAVQVERHVFKRFLNEIQKITNKEGKVAVFRMCSGCQNASIQLNSHEKLFYLF
jgi:CRISPR-associated endonuclease Cas2